jgi:hypothetical protein
MPRSGNHANHCTTDEIEPLYEQLVTPARQIKKRNAQATPSTSSTPGEKPTRKFYSQEVRTECAQKYALWVQQGKPRKRGASPIPALMEKYGFDEHFPHKCFNQFLKTGSPADGRKSNGRKRVFGKDYEDAVVVQVKEKAKKRRKPSGRSLAAALKKVADTVIPTTSRTTRSSAASSANDDPPPPVKGPSRETCRQLIKRLNYHITPCKRKPYLNKKLMDARLQFALEHCDDEMLRTVIFDEKWFTERKGTNNVILTRPGSPVPDDVLYYGREAETETQLKKMMFLVAICEEGPIGMWEIDFNSPANVTLGGEKGKGLTSALLNKYLEEMHTAAEDKLGSGFAPKWHGCHVNGMGISHCDRGVACVV